ncbi:hypothetical protein ALP57_200116 [Pseudomonas coronafaciens pv. oryzae]|nr:hypothetical protein ALP57_200116 [Pseudomonas coronafaciens pv. oryzae]
MGSGRNGAGDPRLRPIAVPSDCRLGGQIPLRADGFVEASALLDVQPAASLSSGAHARRAAGRPVEGPDADRLARAVERLEGQAHARRVAVDRLSVAGAGHGRLPGRWYVPVPVHRGLAGPERHGHGVWSGPGDHVAGDCVDHHRQPDLGADRGVDWSASSVGRAVAASCAIHGGVSGQRPVPVCSDRNCRLAPESRHLALAADGPRYPVVHPVQRDRRGQCLADRSA